MERSVAGQTCVSTGPGRCETVDDGCGREQSARWCARVNTYWAQAFIQSGRWFFHDCSRVDVCALRWPAGQPPLRTPAWSAAFVSTVIHAAGLSDEQFPRTPYHVDYVRAALDRSEAASRIEPVPASVEPGSLVCALRGVDPLAARSPVELAALLDEPDRDRGDDGLGFAELVRRPQEHGPGPVADRSEALARALAVARIDALRSSVERGGPTPMHCDIIVAVDRAGRQAEAIGGNVMQSVSRLHYPLDAEGRVTAVAGAIASPLLVMQLRPAVK